VNVLMMAAEMAPYVKVGGLGDVTGSLPSALRRLGHDVRVVIPRYGTIDPAAWGLERVGPQFAFQAGYETIEASLLRADLDGVEVYFVEIPWLFGDRHSIYGHGDDERRFVLFSFAALQGMERLGWKPDVAHVNDWHTAAVPAVLKGNRLGSFFSGCASVLTIHNIAYQGHTHHGALGGAALLLPAWTHDHGLNILGAGLSTADLITAVSPTFATEIATPEGGAGLDWLIRSRQDRLHGVLNGIDTAMFDPATDPEIAANYTAEDTGLKAACKQALQQEAGFPQDPGAPLLAMIGRLVDQKGFDLMAAAIEPLLIQAPVQLVILGTGHPHYHDLLGRLEQQYPGRIRAWLTFDRALAHRIYAGANMLLMPSRFEPCGLGQMIAMRYGTVPVVRAVGGLVDTVYEGPPGLPGTGFVFGPYDVGHFQDCIRRALGSYWRPGEWLAVMRNGMRIDFSWDRSAAEYDRLYRLALQLHRG
jgi:starch synthase